MLKKTAVVSTTIRIPTMLEGYCRNAKAFYHHGNIKVFLIADKKTPQEARELCARLSSPIVQIQYLDIEEQEQTLKVYPQLLKIIPYNSASRKLLGMLIAYLEGFENIIALDDDNFATGHDFFGCHDIVGGDIDLPLVQSPSGWFNVCEYLREEHNVYFYYRGFPWSQRKVERNLITTHHGKLRVVVNSGFWLGDPDIDATSRLFWPIQATGMRSEIVTNFGLFPGTWCPFNNQNTAMAREVIPAYFTPHNAKRYTDVWPAYVVCRIAEHLGHVISYGLPFVHHQRNPHNYWQDIDDEKVGAQATEPLINLLRYAKLTGDNYHDCLGQLLKHLNNQMTVIEGCPPDQRDMLVDFIRGMEVWHDIFR